MAMGKVLMILSMVLATTYGLFDSLDNVFNVISDGVATTMGWEATGPLKKVKGQYGHHGVADYSTAGLPKIRMGGRVIDLVNAIHFDDLLQDTPDELRPPSFVAFYNSQDAACLKEYKSWNFDYLAERELPARERVMLARYDMYSAPIRAWYKFTPEMDLAGRFDANSCPTMVYVPPHCDGFTKWCLDETESDGTKVMGCKNFKDQCTGWEHWDGKGNLKSFISRKIEENTPPKISPFLKNYHGQGEWMKSRDHTTGDNHLRNIYLAQAFPAFSPTGFKPLPIPEEFNEWLLGFYKRHQRNRRSEYWNAESTQMSFHAVPTTFLDMDKERYAKEQMAIKHLKPVVEEWANLSNLELTSFYGMREYPNESVLKNHVDRIDTHVLSVTITVKKLDEEAAAAKPWPLEVVRWDGRHVRYDHPAGTMILYESSKLPHGRPYQNQGGVHVGCFAHFKPKDMGGAKWEEIVSRARKNQRDNTQHYGYRSTPSVEPENPVYSEVKYGEKSEWRFSEDEDEREQVLARGQFTVTFTNKGKKVYDVYWSSPDGEGVHQGTVGPNASFEINTFQNHQFFWSEVGKETPLPGGTMTMEKGRTVYAFEG